MAMKELSFDDANARRQIALKSGYAVFESVGGKNHRLVNLMGLQHFANFNAATGPKLRVFADDGDGGEDAIQRDIEARQRKIRRAQLRAGF